MFIFGGNSNSIVSRRVKSRERTEIACLSLKFGGITCKKIFRHENTAFWNSGGASLVILEGRNKFESNTYEQLF